MNLAEMLNQAPLMFDTDGLFPIPLNGKRPVATGWTKVTRDEWHGWFHEWVRKRGPLIKSIGTRLDNLLAVDIDVEDPEKVEEITHTILKGRGNPWFVRSRAGSPRKVLVWQYPSSVSLKKVTGKYECGQVEVMMGHKFQIALIGEHPSGAEYSWKWWGA